MVTTETAVAGAGGGAPTIYIPGERHTVYTTITSIYTATTTVEHTETQTLTKTETVPITSTVTVTAVPIATAVLTIPTPTTMTHTAVTATAVATAVQPQQEVESAKALVVARLNRLIDHAQMLVSMYPMERGWSYILYDLRNLLSRAEKASSVDELREVEQAVARIEDSLGVKTSAVSDRLVVRTESGEVKALDLRYTIALAKDSASVVGENIDFKATVSKDSIDISTDILKGRLNKQEIAKLYAGLVASASIFTRDNWRRLYESVGGDRFSDALTKWMKGESLSSEDIWVLVNGATALKMNEPLIDIEKASEIARQTSDSTLAMYSTQLREGIMSLLSPWERAWINLSAGLDKDKALNEAISKLVDRILKGEKLGLPQGAEARWTYHDIATKIAEYMPFNIIYRNIYDRLKDSIGGPAAAAVASAAIVALLSAIPYAGAATGAAGAVAGAMASKALVMSHIATGIASLTDLISQIKDPKLREEFIDWLSNQGGWQTVASELTAAVASGAATGLATHYAMQKILVSPNVWSRLPERVRQGFVKLGISPSKTPVEESKAMLRIENYEIEGKYDPESKVLTIEVRAGGKAEILSRKPITKEVIDKMTKVVAKVGGEPVSIDPNNPASIQQVAQKYLELFAATAKDPKMLKLVLENVDDVAELILKDIIDPKTFEKGFLLDIKYFKGLNGNAIIMQDRMIGEAQNIAGYRIIGASKDGSRVVDIRTAGAYKLNQIYELVEKVGFQIGGAREVAISPGSRIGDYNVMLNFKFYGVNKEVSEILTDVILKSIIYRHQLVTGGIPLEYYSTQLATKAGPEAAKMLNNVVNIANELAKQGIETIPVAIQTENQLHIVMLAPSAVSMTSISNAISKAVEEGAKPSNLGLKEVPIHTTVYETATVTQTVTSVAVKPVTVATAVLSITHLKEHPVTSVETIPIEVTKTAITQAVVPRVVQTAVVETIPLREYAVREVETIPLIATETAVAVAVVPRIIYTAVVETIPLREYVVTEIEKIPLTVTETAVTRVVVPRTIPTAVVETIPLEEQAVTETVMETALVTAVTQVVGVAPRIVPVAVTETGVVQIDTVTVYNVLYSQLTVVLPPITQMFTEAVKGEEAVQIAKAPEIVKAPPLAAPGATPAKPERPAKLEREVIVI